MQKLADISMFERLQSNANAGFMSDLSVFNFTTPKLADISAFENLSRSQNAFFVFNAPNDSDADLMDKLKNGDNTALDELMNRHQQFVIATLRPIVGNSSDIDDLSQEVFMKVFRAAATYVPSAKFTTWLRTIAKNVALNAKMKKQVHREKQTSSLDPPNTGDGNEDMSFEDTIPASGLTPPEALEKNEERRMVRQTIQNLPPDQRQAIIAFEYQKKDYQKIADEMGVPLNSVKQLIFLARKTLRDKLTPYIQSGRLPN